MRGPAGAQDWANRRAAGALLTTLWASALPPAAWAGDRITAQSVGIDQKPLGDFSIVWGGNKRCDPTDTGCGQGGRSDAESVAQVQPLPNLSNVKVTDRVSLEVSVSSQSEGTLVIGLFREEAPNAVDTFVRLCAGTLKNEPEEEPAGLARSTAARVIRDRALVLGSLKQQGGSTQLVAGRTRPQRFPVQPPLYSDANGLSHTAAGLVSVRRGGGSFEITITPRANTDLDREWIVIGEVLDGMELLERLNVVPTNNYDRQPLVTIKVERVFIL